MGNAPAGGSRPNRPSNISSSLPSNHAPNAGSISIGTLPGHPNGGSGCIGPSYTSSSGKITITGCVNPGGGKGGPSGGIGIGTNF